MSMGRLKCSAFAKSKRPYQIWKFKQYVKDISPGTPYTSWLKTLSAIGVP